MNADAECTKSSNVVGKGGAQYKKHGAFCLETQKYADAIHHVREQRPKILLRENDVFSLAYFSTEPYINNYVVSAHLSICQSVYQSARMLVAVCLFLQRMKMCLSYFSSDGLETLLSN